MASRITARDIEHYLALLNKAIGAPTEVYRRDDSGEYVRGEDNRLVQNPKTLCLDWAYGGVRLCSEAGARELSGRMTKREMYQMLSAMWSLLRHIDPDGTMREEASR
jgi:hypothetical protein